MGRQQKGGKQLALVTSANQGGHALCVQDSASSGSTERRTECLCSIGSCANVGFRACRYEPGGRCALLTRTAQILYSGIFEIGSWAEIVTWLMLRGVRPVVVDRFQNKGEIEGI